jgi:glycolate oxidase iron-sulfur subunit
MASYPRIWIDAWGPALEAARQLLNSARPIPLSARLVHAVMAEPSLRRPALTLARLLRPIASLLAGESTLGFGLGMLAATRPLGKNGRRIRMSDSKRPTAEATLPRAAVVFRGCIMEGLFGHVHRATARVLRANGYDVVDAPGQGCCGALHAHAGQHDTAADLARRNVQVFAEEPESIIVVNSAGCGALLKDYGRVLDDDSTATALAARVCDVTELLADSGPREGGRLELRVAYDPPCHLLHAQGVAHAPLAVLDAIPGLERVLHTDAELCCGSAGSYSLTQRQLSQAVLQRKIAALTDAAPDVVVNGNPGCAMQIGAGLLAAGKRIPVLHPVELLDLSYQRAGLYGN